MSLLYTLLAPYYDLMYADRSPREEVDFFCRIFDRHKKNANTRILNLCCGTGIHDQLLVDRGFEVVGIDASEEMLQMAKRKNPGIRYEKGTMSDIKVEGTFGAILCFYNAILYNADEIQMRYALFQAAKLLDNGGVFICDAFDCDAAYPPVRQKRWDYRDSAHQLSIIPTWEYDKNKQKLLHRLECTFDGEELSTTDELGAFRLDQLQRLMEETGFIVHRYDNVLSELRPFSNDSFNAIFVSTK